MPNNVFGGSSDIFVHEENLLQLIIINLYM